MLECKNSFCVMAGTVGGVALTGAIINACDALNGTEYPPVVPVTISATLLALGIFMMLLGKKSRGTTATAAVLSTMLGVAALGRIPIKYTIDEAEAKYQEKFATRPGPETEVPFNEKTGKFLLEFPEHN